MFVFCRISNLHFFLVFFFLKYILHVNSMTIKYRLSCRADEYCATVNGGMSCCPNGYTCTSTRQCQNADTPGCTPGAIFGGKLCWYVQLIFIYLNKYQVMGRRNNQQRQIFDCFLLVIHPLLSVIPQVQSNFVNPISLASPIPMLTQ